MSDPGDQEECSIRTYNQLLPGKKKKIGKARLAVEVAECIDLTRPGLNWAQRHTRVWDSRRRRRQSGVNQGEPTPLNAQQTVDNALALVWRVL